MATGIEREREREREKIDRDRERERETRKGITLTMMRLFQGVVTVILFSTADAILSIYKNFLAPDEIEFYKNIPVSESNKGSCKGADRVFGHVNLDKNMRSRIQDASQKSCSIDEDGDIEEMEVRTSLIHRTTDAHLDRVNGTGHEYVSFVFLNTNEDAYFVHGDTEVPAMAGSMVTFAGNFYHHTRVNSGHIHLLGPFDSNTYEPIGCGVTITCCGEVVNRADVCLAACNNPQNGVVCSVSENDVSSSTMTMESFCDQPSCS
jgi:hypothetical protein